MHHAFLPTFLVIDMVMNHPHHRFIEKASPILALTGEDPITKHATLIKILHANTSLNFIDLVCGCTLTEIIDELYESESGVGMNLSVSG